ncbi:hypothetical protein MaudCBS49596_004668 [Microsporum audouinii]
MSSPSFKPVTETPGPYKSLFNPDEIIQSNQEAQAAAIRQISSYSNFGDDEIIDNDDESGSEGRDYKSEGAEIPYTGDHDPFEEAYEPPSSPEMVEGVSTRLNKFHGPPSTWRGWTERERHDFAALETIRSRDLSIHLYNSFMLKKAAKEAKAKNLAHSMLNGTPSEEKPHSASLFAPSRGWAAWPMPVDEVPRADERINRDSDDAWTLRMAPDDRPSAELEECLISHMMKSSRERFEARPWDWRGARRFEREGSPEENDNQSLTTKEESEFSDFHLPRPKLRPVVQTDDDKSRRLLRPEARNIIGKLDDLLLSLQEARSTYSSMPQGLINESKIPNLRARNSATSPPNRRSNPSSEAGSENEKDDDDDSASISPSRGPENNVEGFRTFPPTDLSPQKQPVRFGLRDWSEIIGVASLTGWPAAAVMRASRRCADLFGEDQVFRTMHEGTVRLGRAEDGMPCWRHAESDQSETDSTLAEGRPTSRGIDNPKQDAKYCPVTGCSRQLRGFSRSWNLNQHLKNAHSDLLAESKIKLVKRAYK